MPYPYDSRILGLLTKRWAIIGFLLTSSFLTGSVLCAGEAATPMTIGGTGSALGGIRDVAAAFQKKHPQIQTKIVSSLGSSGGINAVLAGTLDLALSVRPLTAREKEGGAEAIEYARTPLVFIAPSSASAQGLTLRQVATIYAGDMQAWPDGTPIRLVIRPEADTDTQLLKTMTPEMARAAAQALSREGLLVAMTDQENADFLSTVKGAFGVMALGQIVSEKRSLHPLCLDGVCPSLAALASGAYPYYKVLYVVTGPRSTTAARQFIDFLLAREGAAILSRTGHLVRPEAR